MPRDWRAAAAIVLALGLAATAAAQETTGTITGAVTDTTGALLPGVTVTVKYVPTGTVRPLTTNAAGLYTAPLLQPGDYEVTFALSGFQASTVRASTPRQRSPEANGTPGRRPESERRGERARSSCSRPPGAEPDRRD